MNEDNTQTDPSKESGEKRPRSEECEEERQVKQLKTENNTQPEQSNNLGWDENHWDNAKHEHCYCKQPRGDGPLLFCDDCKQWFHEDCIDYIKREKTAGLLIGHHALLKYTCRNCSSNGLDLVELRFKLSWKPVLAVVYFHLIHLYKIEDRTLNVRKEVIPFMDENWNTCWWGTPKERAATWEITAASQCQVDGSQKRIYFDQEAAGCTRYALSRQCWKVLCQAPCVDEELSLGILDKVGRSSSSAPARTVAKPKKERSSFSEIDSKFSSQVHLKKVKDKEKKKEREPKPKKPTPAPLALRRRHRVPHTLTPPADPLLREKFFSLPKIQSELERLPMHLSPQHSAPHTHILTHTTATNAQGYRVVLASRGVTVGDWFFDAAILPPKHTRPETAPHTRIGFATVHADVQAPCGYDCFGYSYRDVTGTVYHRSRSAPGVQFEPYGPGDTLRFHIHLPPANAAPITYEADLKTKAFIENPREYLAPCVDGSYIDIYKNGQRQGRAFTNLTHGRYFPAFSMYYGGLVQAVFPHGPAAVFAGVGPDGVSPVEVLSLGELYPRQQCPAKLSPELFLNRMIAVPEGKKEEEEGDKVKEESEEKEKESGEKEEGGEELDSGKKKERGDNAGLKLESMSGEMEVESLSAEEEEEGRNDSPDNIGEEEEFEGTMEVVEEDQEEEEEKMEIEEEEVVNAEDGEREEEERIVEKEEGIVEKEEEERIVEKEEGTVEKEEEERIIEEEEEGIVEKDEEGIVEEEEGIVDEEEKKRDIDSA